MESPTARPHGPPTRGIVLVTGASGYVGAQICLLLLRRNFSVRACVRSASKATSFLHHISLALQRAPPVGPDGNYWQGTDMAGRWDTVTVPDMTAPACYDDAMVGCVAAVHVASPLSTSKAYVDWEAELARPIVQGTLNILSAAHRTPTCHIVALTSTFGTALRTRQALPYTFSETDWNTQSRVDDGGIESYRAAKTMAEKEAWRFVKENESKFELVTLCPPQIIGPLIHDLSPSAWESSLSNIHSILSNLVESGSATGGAGFVDVRDVAEAHARAVEMGVNGEFPWRASRGRSVVEGKDGKEGELPAGRIIIAEGTHSWLDFARTVSASMPSPLLTLFPSRLTPSGTPDVKSSACVFGIDNAKSKAVLAMRYRTFEESVRDSLEQYAELVQARDRNASS